MIRLKGIAFLIPILIIAGTIASAAIANTFYHFDTTPATNSSDPVEIVGTGAVNVPWADLYDLFFGGLLGVMIWISRYFIVPFINLIASFFAGRQIEFPVWYGYIVLAIFAILILWGKKDSIWEFITEKLMWGLLILAVVFVLGLTLTMLGAI